MVKIGIVGTGGTVGIANKHLEAIKHDGRGEVVAVFNKHSETGKKWIEDNRLQAVPCNTYQELLDLVDAVIICTPNSTHYEYAKKAMEKGKHFLLEKPMALTIEESEDLLNLSKKSPSVSMVGFVYRYSSAVKKARELVSEKIGRIYSLSVWFGGTRLADTAITDEWRMKRNLSGSGALGDFGSHVIDLANFIADQKYNRVSCLSKTFVPGRENDDCSVLLASGENGLGNYTLSRVGQDSIRMNIAGSGGMLELNLRDEGRILFWEKKPDGPYTGSFKKIDFEKDDSYRSWFIGEIKEFLDSIENNTDSYPSIRDGYYVDCVLHSAEQSAQEGRLIDISK